MESPNKSHRNTKRMLNEIMKKTILPEDKMKSLGQPIMTHKRHNEQIHF